MIYVKPRAAAEMTLSITAAANLMDLIDTAGSTTGALNYYLRDKLCNVVRITPTSGSIRYAWETTPTAANGAYLGNGNYEYIGGDLSNLKIISTSGTATVSIVYYRANAGELAAIAGGGGGGGGASSGVYAEDSAATSGDNGVSVLAVRQDTIASSTSTDGDYGWVKQDSLGAQYGREVYAPTYEDNTVGVAKVEQRFSPSYISTATTTTIKSGAGFLHTITITESVASTIIVYDNTAGSGTIVASFVASAGVGTYTLNVSFGTGLTIVTAGASKLTVSYR